MSLIRDLYTVFDREYARHRAQRSSKNSLLQEFRRNLAFLREGLAGQVAPEVLIDGLEDQQFRKALESGFRFDSLQRRRLARATCAGVPAFERYQGWSSERLICRVYERVAILQKLGQGKSGIDLGLRLQNLFKLMMLVTAHLEGRQLTIRRQ